MARRSELTLGGALAILGHHDRNGLDRLDKLLGGALLASGAVAGAAVLGAGALAPAAAVVALWGWVDQKNEAVTLARSFLDGLAGRLRKTSAYERHQLLLAAHTTIIIAAFFETYREGIGEAAYERLELTRDEQIHISLKAGRENATLVEGLYSSAFPAPPGWGFAQTTVSVRQAMATLLHNMEGFARGLEARPRRSFLDTTADFSTLTDKATERYRSHFLTLAATVPEFSVWASLGEHAATRAEIAAAGHAMLAASQERSDAARHKHERILQALDHQKGAFARLEHLLRQSAASGGRPTGAREAVVRAHRGALDERIVPAELATNEEQLSFPTVRESFVEPSYRIAIAQDPARLGDESWWERRPRADDLDLFLTGALMAPASTEAPVLLLGHPGAGKSLLTKVLAARLPEENYTVVRVPLREVGASSPVRDQIQNALDAATNNRVTWSDLAEETGDTLRVVLLDGLDELLQAAGNRGGYLLEVAEFQRVEALQRRPVAVLVTSRTVVVDGVTVPRATTVVKLEPFSEAQTTRWLDIWNRVNAPAIAAGDIRGLDPEAALARADLASQPLLLLMLALYVSDVSAPPLDEDVSHAVLYGRLLENFAYREVRKSRGASTGPEVHEAVREQLWRLSVAAFAMFNRGRQNVTEDELGSDLIALEERPPGASHSADVGRRLIGQFFFVHTAQATLGGDATRRCYEFLHATFGEFLLASLTVDTLVDTAEAFAGRRRGPRQPDDDLLYALLSHEPLSTRPTTLAFAGDLFAALPEAERRRVLNALETLIATVRHRHGSDRYGRYRPTAQDGVREIAVYSANLFLLRVRLAPTEPLVLSRLWPGQDWVVPWRSTVRLWRACMTENTAYSVLSTVRLCGSSLVRNTDPLPALLIDVMEAKLAGDAHAALRARYGHAFASDVLFAEQDDDWFDVVWSWLIRGEGLSGEGKRFIVPAPPRDADPWATNEVALTAVSLLAAPGDHTPDVEGALMRLVTLLGWHNTRTSALRQIDENRPHLRERYPEFARELDSGPLVEDFVTDGRTGRSSRTKRWTRERSRLLRWCPERSWSTGCSGRSMRSSTRRSSTKTHPSDRFGQSGCSVRSGRGWPWVGWSVSGDWR